MAQGSALEQPQWVQDLFYKLEVLTAVSWSCYPIVVFFGRATSNASPSSRRHDHERRSRAAYEQETSRRHHYGGVWTAKLLGRTTFSDWTARKTTVALLRLR